MDPLTPLAFGESPLSRKGRGAVTLLAPLPVAALRLPPGPTQVLERLGLKTIGALAEVPRRSLARRFREADNPLDALDRMLGRRPEPLSATPAEPPPRSDLPAGRAGRRSGGDGTGAGADGRALVRRAGPAAAGRAAGGVPGLPDRRRGRRGRGRDRSADARSGASGAAAGRARRDARPRIRVRRVRAGRRAGASRWTRRRTR